MSVRHWPEACYLIAGRDDLESLPRKAHPPQSEGALQLGNKAWNLWRMAQAGLRVPPALVLGTRYAHRPASDWDEALFSAGLPELERITGRRLGDARRPLLVSVRSGAPVSMPGMMETVLDVGLCNETVPGMLRLTGNPRLVWDSYRRLVAGYGEVVAGIDPGVFEAALAELAQGQEEQTLAFDALRALTRRYLECYREQAGEPFPQSVRVQLRESVRAVFASWNAPKAVDYRRHQGIDDALGTAVTIQQMVFGNADRRSGAGVGFTRDPTDGTPRPWVDFLFEAQGEDVVSGRRSAVGHERLAARLPQVWAELGEGAARLERLFADMQDFEFTVEEGTLFWLQARAGKRTPRAAARIALDLLAEGVIDARTAWERTRDLALEELATVCLATAEGEAPQRLGSGIPASPGIAGGELALDAERVAQRAAQGAKVILVRQDAETADVAALRQAEGLLTRRGARTSHAAVVARQMGKVCVVGCETLTILPEQRAVRFGERVVAEGETITLDGNEGGVYAGLVRTQTVPDAALQAQIMALRARFAAECADA
ncbi:PEP/pyruvate-binding domain-containing protein [Tepidiphilus olei]|uniref:PEP/pyruvate-binding domain-containing protein n=1 Tax=Tepidiphilus olei TaxID=2502184 RepID=UPI00115CA1A4|nr:PEP/pyruvate-binding domain-containing protein [Tepidiphilus olei]